MSSTAPRFGVMPLFSLLVLFLSLFNLSGAAPLPAGDQQPATIDSAWGDVYPFGMSPDEALAVLAQMAESPTEATEAAAAFKDELNKAKQGQASTLTDQFFDAIDSMSPGAYLAALDSMSANEQPADANAATLLQRMFSSPDMVDTTASPGGIVYDATNDGVAVSDDSTKVKAANPGLMDRFSFFGKGSQLMHWMAASLRALKAAVTQAKAAGTPLDHDAQIDTLRSVQTKTSRTQDAAAMSYSEGKAFVILHEPEGEANEASFFMKTIKPTLVKLADTTPDFHPAALPDGSTNLEDGLKLDDTKRFSVKITSSSDPAAHVVGQSAAIEGTPEGPDSTNPQAPEAPDSQTPVDPNDNTNKPKTNKPPKAPARPPKA